MEADPKELELEDFRADLEVGELELELEPLDLGLLEYELEELFSPVFMGYFGPLSPIVSVEFLG